MLDAARITLADHRTYDLSGFYVVCTSNVGSGPGKRASIGIILSRRIVLISRDGVFENHGTFVENLTTGSGGHLDFETVILHGGFGGGSAELTCVGLAGFVDAHHFRHKPQTFLKLRTAIWVLIEKLYELGASRFCVSTGCFYGIQEYRAEQFADCGVSIGDCRGQLVYAWQVVRSLHHLTSRMQVHLPAIRDVLDLRAACSWWR